jgi:hypothetical protein
MADFDLIGENCQVTRRHFFQLGGSAIAAWNLAAHPVGAASIDPKLEEAVANLQYLTSPDRMGAILDKGRAGVAKLPPDKLREIGWFRKPGPLMSSATPQVPA